MRPGIVPGVVQTMSNPDFPSAARRHLRDAQRLVDDSPGNALYLAGYAAECALKAAVERPRLHAPAFGHQLAKLEQDGFDLAIALAPGMARYRPPAQVIDKIRSRWSESRRYESTGDTKSAQARELVDSR
jgi:hypothetical protein